MDTLWLEGRAVKAEPDIDNSPNLWIKCLLVIRNLPGTQPVGTFVNMVLRKNVYNRLNSALGHQYQHNKASKKFCLL